MPAEVTDWLSAGGTIAAAGAAVWAVFVAKKQLKSAVDQLERVQEGLRVDGLMAILQLECEINSRKQKMVEVSVRIAEEAERKIQRHRILRALQGQFKAAIENYLNSVDRLAFCILKGYVPGKDWRAEYRNAIANDISTYPDFFPVNSPYRNIVDLNDLWQRE